MKKQRRVVVSAPGKIYLMGEHAAVYGKPALLAAIERRVTVSIEHRISGGVDIISTESTEYVRNIVALVQDHLGARVLPAMAMRIESDIPAGFHLGSSAAVAVASIGALLYRLKTVWNPERINKLAYEAEKIMHGNPSGADNTAAVFGGIIWYRKELEFLKSIWQFPFAPHNRLAHFYLVNTGKPEESTAEMVALVKQRMENEELRMEKLLNANEAQTKRLAAALKEGNEEELMDAIQKGQRSLEDMGVVSRKAALIIRFIEKSGGAAKILGGGGKKGNVGYLLCYHPDKSNLTAVCGRYGYPLEDVRLGGEGVRLEK